MNDEHHRHHTYISSELGETQVWLCPLEEVPSTRELGLEQLLLSNGRLRVHSLKADATPEKVRGTQFVIRYEWPHGERVEWVYCTDLDMLIKTMDYIRRGLE